MLAEIEINPQILQKNYKNNTKFSAEFWPGAVFDVHESTGVTCCCCFSPKNFLLPLKLCLMLLSYSAHFSKNLCLVFFDISQKHILLLNWIHAWLWRPWLCKWTIRKEESPDEYKIEKSEEELLKAAENCCFSHIYFPAKAIHRNITIIQ